MRGKLNVILFLDDDSRKQLRIDISDLSMNGVQIIYDLKEITNEMLKQTRNVVILESYPAMRSALSNLRLYKDAYNLTYYYIGTDREYLNCMELIALCYKMEISFLDFERLQAVLINDTALIAKHTVEDNALKEDLKKQCEILVTNKSQNDETRKIAEAYLRSQIEIEFIRELYDNTDNIKEQLNRKYLGEVETSEKLIKAYSEMVVNSREVSKNLSQYEAILSKDVYSKIAVNEYERAPIILYLKEYQELLHFESFLWTLSMSIKAQLKRSVKVLKLYDSSGSKKVLANPPRYHRLRNVFTGAEVKTNDFLLKCGDYRKVLDIILTNSINLDVLIIVDCKDHDDVVTIGRTSVFNLCRNEKYLDVFGLSSVNTIFSNSRDYKLSWDTDRTLPKLKKPEDRLLLLSSKTVIKEILQVLEIELGGI